MASWAKAVGSFFSSNANAENQSSSSSKGLRDFSEDQALGLLAGTTPAAEPEADHDYPRRDRDGNVMFDEETGERTEIPRVLGTVGLSVLIFFTTCGAVFGTEAAVQDGGIFYTLIGYVTFPILFSAPLALVATELSCAMSENGGSVVWVQRAFGDFWGWLAGWVNFISGLFSVAVWPTLIYSYLDDFFGAGNQTVFSTAHAWGIKIGVVIFVFMMSAVGIAVVGHAATFLFIMIQLPFIVEIVEVIRQGKVDPSAWLAGVDAGSDSSTSGSHSGGVQWGGLFNTLLWLFAGYDLVGTFAGEIRDVKRSMPRGIMFSVLLSIVAYSIPLMTAACVDSKSSNWNEGYLVEIAQMLCNGGNPEEKCWLGYWMLFAACSNSFSQYSGIMNAYSRSLWAMGRGKGEGLKFFPIVGYTHPRFKTPIVAQLFLSITTIILMSFDFSLLVACSNGLYCLLVIAEFCTFLYLRYSRPELPRPFKIPGNFVVAVLMVTPPFVLMGISMFTSGWLVWAIDVGILAGIAVAFYLRKLVLRWWQRRQSALAPLSPEAYLLSSSNPVHVQLTFRD
jgi:amino acid transporter